MYRIAISPQGILGLIASPGVDAYAANTAELPTELIAGFESSVASGITQLAAHKWHTKVVAWSAEFSFWRSYGRRYFQALCRQYAQQTGQWISPACPDATTLDELLRAAPPMPGLEYLGDRTFQRVWEDLDAFTRVEVGGHAEGLPGYLRSLDPAWNLIGRVTFHLAENKKNADAPFAFLATYTQGQSTLGAPQHLPLSEALRQSIAAKDTAKLDQLLEPVTRAAKSCSFVAQLIESRKLFAPQAWGIGQAYAFLSSVPAMEQAGIVVRVPNWWNATRPPRPQVSVRLGSREPSVLGLGQLDLQVDVAIEGEPLGAEELEQLLAARDGLLLLRGKWVQVDQDQLRSALKHWQLLQKQHLSGIDFLQGMRLLSGATIGQGEIDDAARSWSRVEPGPWLQQVLQKLRDPGGDPAIDPESGIHASLRHYQMDGVRWLWFATQLGLGVCLADDMGLGKTLQVISLIVQLKQHSAAASDGKAPCLLIVPTSLLGNWQREVGKFAPQLSLFVAHRSVADADKLRRVESDPHHQLSGYDAVMITYGMVRKADWLKDMNWRLIVLDEAQAIKNAQSAQTRAIKKIPARCRITMTGTPIENHLGDLWSLFDFSSPGLLGKASEFKRFVSSKDDAERSRRLSALRTLIQPYILRRLKTDPHIMPDLPAKTEMRVDCGLSPTQAALYAEVIKDLERTLEIASGIQRRGIVLAVLMQLKQICNHPALYLKQGRFNTRDSGKYQELARLCETMAEKQEKVLVFSQFQSMCEPLSQFLTEIFGRPGLILTGKTSAKSRSKLVMEFQQPFGPPHFVISVKAGSTGLNLTEACHVVHFDRWWNPAVEDQATDRAFRIGQTRNVLVHKFVSLGTLEERIDDLIQSKRQISEELFDQSGELNLTEMSDEQLLDFISLDLTKASTT